MCQSYWPTMKGFQHCVIATHVFSIAITITLQSFTKNYYLVTSVIYFHRISRTNFRTKFDATPEFVSEFIFGDAKSEFQPGLVRSRTRWAGFSLRQIFEFSTKWIFLGMCPFQSPGQLGPIKGWSTYGPLLRSECYKEILRSRSMDSKDPWE